MSLPLRVFSQASPSRDASVAEMSVRTFTRGAELRGIPVYYVPVDWDECNAEEALSYVPVGSSNAVLVGYIADNDYYRELDAALREKEIVLINTPDQSERAQEFENFYPLISDLTAKSVIVSGEADIPNAVNEIGFPMLVKGGIKSNKEEGWKACVVNNEVEFSDQLSRFAKPPILARGKMIARQILPLRRTGDLIGGFPESREYRAYVVFGETLEHGYYWQEHDPLGPLSNEESREMHQLVKLAAHRIGCPLMTVDVGQLESGKWIVIETGDLQYSGVNQMNPLRFWASLEEHLRSYSDTNWA